MHLRSGKSFVSTKAILAGAGLAAALYGLQVGCSSQASAPNGPGSTQPSGTSPSDDLGSIGMKLTLPGGESLTLVNWVITGPNGASTQVQSGNVNLGGSNSISFQVGGIPAGTNYDIALSGTSPDGLVTCAGSATFSVLPRATTNVTVLLQCGAPVSEAGAANVGAQAFDCASAGSLSASPAETTIGNSVSLSGSGNGPNPGGLTYLWTASSGQLSSPTSANTSFTCTAQGPVTVTLTVADGTVPDGGSCNGSPTSASVQVQCDVASSSEGGGGSPVCALGNGGAIKHVIYIQFDNTHLSRDQIRSGTSNVPSDLEQMPHLLNFIRGNGTMLANDHTQLISHTSVGMVTSLTGVYPDRHGMTVGNSYVRTNANGSFSFPSAFGYWTDQAYSNTTVPNMVQPDGTQMPAPWVSYTRAGCNFGAVATANTVLENTGTGAAGDITKVFGTGSPQYQEAIQSNGATHGTALYALAVTDFEGLAVHCASGSSVCATGQLDALPNEPGGYNGFYGLFGAKSVNPVLTGATGDASVAVTDLNGNPIVDTFGQPGFPGFDGMEAAVSLGYVAAMQEHGVPVTYAYISDAHDNHGNGSQVAAYGPGDPGYVAQLQAYDQAFATFFTRLASDGIDKTNTLFVFTVDEGDHFVGGAPTPANCDGVNIPCTWASGQIGEVNVNIDTLVSNEAPAIASKFLGSGAPNSFTVHGDDAPTFYLSRVGGDAGPIGALTQTEPDTRNFERAAAGLTLQNPYTGNTDPLLYRMADQVGMQAVHMYTTGDLGRNPVFTYFANDDYYITDYPSSTCADCIVGTYAWNHGDDQNVIGQTWLSFVGPGVRSESNGGNIDAGSDSVVWTDHTDVRATIDSVLGIQESYALDGRVITQALQPSAYSSALAGNLSTVEALGDAYKQINAPFNLFGQCVLDVSTVALQSTDTVYSQLESQLQSMLSTRNTLASQIIAALNAAEFSATAISTTSANGWISQAQALVAQCQALDAAEADAGTPDAGASADASGGTDSGSTAEAGPDAGGSDAGGVTDAGAPLDAGLTAQLVIYRVGSGSGSLSSAATPVFLDEYTFGGALVESIAMPTTASGGQNALVASGSATSEGLITRSADGHYVLLTGYNAAVGTASIAGTSSSTTARIVGRLDASGNVDTTTALNAFSANNPRSVVSPDGTNLWIGGANSGVIYTTLGSTTFTALDTQGLNLRQLELFGGQLYAGTSTSNYVPPFRIGAVGGVPTPTTAPADGGALLIAGLPGFATTGGSPYGFFFATLNGGSGPDTLYVADDGVGITKYSLVAGSWTASGTVGSSANAFRSVVGVVSGTSVTLYATGNGTTLATATDSSGYNGAFSGSPTTLATSSTNEAFRGVALAPQ